MNKKIILSTVALASVLTACDEDYMNQFNIDTEITDVKAVNITLEKSDYGAIASNADNVEKALALEPEGKTYVDALTQVGKQGYFTETIEASEFIPNWLKKKYFHADNGSTFVVTYNQERETSAYMEELSAPISSYTLTDEDYAGVWGDKVKALYLTPQTKSKIGSILLNNSNANVNGNLMAVSYAYSDVEPSIGGGEPQEPESPYATIDEAFHGEANAEFFVKGTVTATYAQGVVISDNTGSILVYQKTTSNYSLGDVLEVKGTITKYSGFMQFGNTAEIKCLEHRTAVKYPEPETMNGDQLTAWCNTPSFKYVKVKGTYTTDGKYYNLDIEGTGARRGSISYPVSGIIDPSLNGKEVELVGYLSGFSAKYIYFMATSVVEAGAAVDCTPVGIAANAEAGDYKVRGVVAETYARGFLLTDGTGNILVYKSDTGAKVGDQVVVSGTTSAYAGLMQYSNKAEVTIVASDGKFTTPAPQALAGADFDSYVAAPYCAYVTYTGTLSISGNYYNVAIDGTAVQGSIAYPNAGAVDAALNGQKVTITGYAIGQTSSGKYLNTMITSVVPAAAGARATRAAAAVEPTTTALYQFKDGAWKQYTTADAQVIVLNDAENAQIAETTLASTKAALPLLLANKLPYIIDGANAVVVYKNGKNIEVAEFEVSNGVWSEVKAYTTETTTFTLEEGEINANQSSFYENTLLGNEGGFTAVDVMKGEGLNYVWANTAQYGWKASAYVNKTNVASESWLVSPAINLKKAKDPVFTMDEVYQYTNGAEPAQYLSLLISTNYADDVKTANWTELTIPTWSTGSDWTFVNTGYISLADYVGSTVTIAFVYKSTSDAAPTWEIKNVKVIERPAEEAE